jgi:tRNA modification GTPase
VAAGARLADPGAFTQRAVTRGRMDLLAAEGVDQTIRATSLAGLQIARDGLEGRVRAALEPLRTALLDVGAELEARLDYPADELAFEDDDALLARLAAAAAQARALADTAAAGRVLVDGARVALVGAVNAGKSSLFNALCGSRRALVHERPGTTRDVLELPVRIGGLQLTLLDTAGERQTDDPIEAAGQALARELVADADLLLVVLRAGPPSEVEATLLARTADRPRLVVYNGVDRPGAPPPPPGAWPTSALTGEGLDALRAALVERLVSAPTGALRLGSVRQRDLLRAFADAADAAAVALPTAGPAVAAEEVLRALGEIDALTGADPREAVLDAVFRRFCIGK